MMRGTYRWLSSYVWKPYEEALRAGLVAASGLLTITLTNLDPGEVVDWRTWAGSVGAGLLVAFIQGVRGALQPPPAM